MLFAIHFRCKLDLNGNPRRFYAVFDCNGKMIDAIDEGYKGHYALLAKYPEFKGRAIEEFDTTPTERRNRLKQFSK